MTHPAATITAQNLVCEAIAISSTIQHYVLARAAVLMGAQEIERQVIGGVVHSTLYWPSYVGGDMAGRQVRACYADAPARGLSRQRVEAHSAFVAAQAAELGI